MQMTQNFETEISQNKEIKKTVYKDCASNFITQQITGLGGQIDIGLSHRNSLQVIPIFCGFLLINALVYLFDDGAFSKQTVIPVRNGMSSIQGIPSIMMVKQHFANCILGNTSALYDVNKYSAT